MNGLFVGLATLDTLYLAESFPHQNEKITALDQSITAGGPATNAGITFRYLGGSATWLGVLGNHPLSQLIKADVEKYNINILDLDPDFQQSPPVSAAIVTQKTGDRAVISINAKKRQATLAQLPDDVLKDIDIVLIDGHQMVISEKIAQQAKAQKIPVVIDGGSWKNGFEKVLPYVDYAICSANFYPPNCPNQRAVFDYLKQINIPYIAMSQGEKSVKFDALGHRGTVEIQAINPVDTLGAGDIFHGAFCYFILQQDFLDALEKASQIATQSCQFFGTRSWMKN